MSGKYGFFLHANRYKNIRIEIGLVDRFYFGTGLLNRLQSGTSFCRPVLSFDAENAFDLEEDYMNRNTFS